MKSGTKKYTVAGLMSGTSLDGLDIAICEFYFKKNKWAFRVLYAETIKYNTRWVKKLTSAMSLSAIELSELDVELANFWGKKLHKVIQKRNLKIDFISSHGHTVFHQPEKGISVQIGRGSEIAAICKLPVVCDFRTTDVALGGQGAPLVPIGDELLFDEFDFCLNIGGIANVSYKHSGRRIAFDICAANMVLNYLAQKASKPYDDDGKLAARGKLIPQLYNKLNHLEYYNKRFPKSLGKEWVDNNVISLITEYKKHSIEDLLHTYTEHIASQIGRIKKLKGEQKKLLITGGGALNIHLVKRIKAKGDFKIILPNKDIINFKEAIIFAFLGLLRWQNKINVLKSVTGASADNCGGVVYWA